MESIFNFRHWWKKEKGVTLVEVVIALSITVIVSLAVVSLSISATTSLAKERAKDFFIHEMGNVTSMYFNYSEDKYAEAFEVMSGTAISGYEDVTLYYDKEFKYADSTDYSYYMSIAYSANEITMSAFNHSNSKIMERVVAR